MRRTSGAIWSACPAGTSKLRSKGMSSAMSAPNYSERRSYISLGDLFFATAMKGPTGSRKSIDEAGRLRSHFRARLKPPFPGANPLRKIDGKIMRRARERAPIRESRKRIRTTALLSNSRMGKVYGFRYRKVVQRPKGIWVYSAVGRREGCVRAHQRRRTGGAFEPRGRPKNP